MGKLIEAGDGLPAEDVGSWVKDKHQYLCRYIDISRAVRSQWLEPGGAGATYIDPFCGPGLCRVRETGEWIDGGVVAAWKKSLEGSAPFSQIYIADLDPARRAAAAARLRMLNAPVVEVEGDALQAAQALIPVLNPHGLHFAFLDPFDLASLDFEIIVALARLKRIDMLVHISQMDLQRNAVSYAVAEESAFDVFAPGWRKAVSISQSQKSLREEVLRYWRKRITDLAVWPSADMKLITAEGNQPLYWLLMAAKHSLANKFWSKASNIEGQGKLDF